MHSSRGVEGDYSLPASRKGKVWPSSLLSREARGGHLLSCSSLLFSSLFSCLLERLSPSLSRDARCGHPLPSSRAAKGGPPLPSSKEAEGGPPLPDSGEAGGCHPLPSSRWGRGGPSSPILLERQGVVMFSLI